MRPPLDRSGVASLPLAEQGPKRDWLVLSKVLSDSPMVLSAWL
jgi:hypothetical protein